MTRSVRFDPPALTALVVSVAAVALSLVPLRSLIEQSMLWHMVIQMPMLILAGWWSMRSFSHTRFARWLERWNRYGLTGLIAAEGIGAFWMLPSAIDRAVVLPQADALKLLTLFACGALLQHSFVRAPAVLQLFFIGYTVPMLMWLGFYFATTDLRLCNAYSLASQVSAGRATVGLGVILGCVWLVGIARQSHVLERKRRMTASPES